MSDMKTEIVNAAKDAAMTTAGAVGVGYLSKKVLKEDLGVPLSGMNIAKMALAIGTGTVLVKMLEKYWEKKS